jgi:DNA-binding transcriptional ArsR family regulator
MRLVKVRREGKVAFYSLDDDHIVHLFTECLRHVQEQVPSEQARRLLMTVDEPMRRIVRR